MVLSAEMKWTIVGLHKNLGYEAVNIVSLIKTEKLNALTVQRVLDKFNSTGSIKRKVGSGRPCSIRTPTNIVAVLKRAVSDTDRPGTHKTIRQIAQDVCYSYLCFSVGCR